MYGSFVEAKNSIFCSGYNNQYAYSFSKSTKKDFTENYGTLQTLYTLWSTVRFSIL